MWMSVLRSVSICPVLLLLLATLAGCVWSFQMTSTTVPAVVDFRDTMELECYFDMGIEDLYGVKWYKDDQEFYRYVPGQEPNRLSFPVAGLHLMPNEDDCDRGHCNVKLWNLSRDHSGGEYRCEVSSEGPTFKLISSTKNVTVAALPKENPRIYDLHLQGPPDPAAADEISLKCVSDPSDPAAILTWNVNGKPVHSQAVGDQEIAGPDKMGLVSRSLTLRLTPDRKLTRGDAIEFQCVSTLPGIPLPPRATTKIIRLRSQGGHERAVSNEKLHWNTASSSQSCSKFGWVAVTVIVGRCITAAIVRYAGMR